MALLTIPNETTTQSYAVTTAQTAFPFTFAVFSKADLHFSVNGVELAQTDFTLTGSLLDGGGMQGGTVNLNVAVSGAACILWRETVTARPTNFSPSPNVPVRDIDVQFNKLTAMMQDMRRDILAVGGGVGGGAVSSVNGRSGVVSLTAGDVTPGFGALVFSNLAAGSGVTLSNLAGVTTINAPGLVTSVAGRTGAVVVVNGDIADFGAGVGAALVAGTNVTIGRVGNVITINAALAGGTVSSAAGSSVNGELVLFNGTSGASLKNSACVPSANGLSLLSAANYAAMLVLLGIGTAGLAATGTAGHTIPYADGANTWSAAQTFGVAPVFTDASGTRTALALGSAALQNVGAFLQVANNLSDLANASTARTNLGVAIGSNVEPFGAYAAQNNQTGTAYTLVLSDAGKLVTMSNASANTLTIPLNASVAFPINTRIDLTSLGVGIETIAATGGVTLNSAGGAVTLRTKFSGGSLVKTASDTWLLVGDLA